MPTNLYGINDNFHPENSHVIPALINRFHKAKINKEPEVVVWGTGKAIRDFMYVDDMAAASLFVLEVDKETYLKNTHPMLSHINIGTGKGITIKELAEMIGEIVGFQGKILFDDSKPDGSMKKLIDVTCLSNMGWKYDIELKEGITITYDWLTSNYV